MACPMRKATDASPVRTDNGRCGKLRERFTQPDHPASFVINGNERRRWQGVQRSGQRGNLRRRLDVATK
jgi:hypothetical protein